MDSKRLGEIMRFVTERSEEAEYILSGDGDNYDGADGARYILELCNICEGLTNELLKFVE